MSRHSDHPAFNPQTSISDWRTGGKSNILLAYRFTPFMCLMMPLKYVLMDLFLVMTLRQPSS